MFQGDDEDDFMLGSSSKLASLFGLGKSSQDGNTSLTYTAPKQPKKGHHVESQHVKGQAVGQSSGQGTPSTAKLSIITAKAVQTYKLADGNYNAQGKLGAAVLGNVETRVYQLLLYKGKQQHVSSVRISPSFQFVVQANNYATFYDDQMQNWSVMFESSGDAIEFAREVGLARVNAMGKQGDQNFVTQDLLFGVGATANEGDVVSLRYIAFPLSACKLGEVVEDTTKSEKPQRVKLKKGSWEEGLLGVAKRCKRMIMLPPFLVGPWKGRVPADSSVVLEVDIASIKSGQRVSLTDSGDSAVDSSTEDTSIKARGVSISEALTNSPKTHKASIISRMAKMGQATLPLKGATVCDPSDSEEIEDDMSGPVDTAPAVVCKMPLKVRPAKSQTSPSSVQNAQKLGGVVPQQLALYQPIAAPAQSHQYMGIDAAVTYIQPQGQFGSLLTQQAGGTQQVLPVPGATISTPTVIPSDTHLPLFLAEMRNQNLEVRMGVAKAVDKVDQVLIKLDDIQRCKALPAMEPSTLLASIQKLVTDNEQLRAELEEKRAKVDQQQEKMCDLLHLNQKYLEQCHDSPMRTLVMTLQQEKEKLSAQLSEALLHVKSLELQVASAGKAEQGLSKEMSAMLSQLKVQQLELENSQKLVQEQKQQLESCRQSTADLQAIRDELGGRVQQFQEKTNACEERMNELVQAHQVEMAQLKKELKAQQQNNVTLMDRVRTLQAQHYDRSSGAADSNTLDEVKKVMNILYHRLQPQFMPSMSYDGLQIRHIFMATIRDVTLKYIKLNSTSDQPSNAAHGTSGHPTNAVGGTTTEHSIDPAHGTSGHLTNAVHGTTSEHSVHPAHGTSGHPANGVHGTTTEHSVDPAHGTSGHPTNAVCGTTSEHSVDPGHGTSGHPTNAVHGTTSEHSVDPAHGTSGHPSNAVCGTTSEHSVDPAHGTSGHPPNAVHGTTSEHSVDPAHDTSQNPTDAAHSTPVLLDALQVHSVQIEPAVALDVGSTMKNSVEHELVQSRTDDMSSKEKLAVRESSDSIQNAEVQTAASGLAGLMTTGGQENDLGNMEGKQSSSDPQKEDGSGQLTARTRAIAPTEMGDGTGHVGDGVEDRNLHKSVVEKSWRPQPPPPPLFDDDDDDDDDWLS